MNIWMPTGFSFSDLVSVQIKYDEDEAKRSLLVCSAYLPFNSEDLPQTREFEELLRHCEEKTLPLIVGCDFNCNHTVWGRANCND
jgi:endonuclease/exonuclease/phosphatase (EEP) superfamily protein YafD